MSTSVSPLHRTLTRGESIALVVGCTFIGAAAQIMMNIGAKSLPPLSVEAIRANPLMLRRPNSREWGFKPLHRRF